MSTISVEQLSEFMEQARHQASLGDGIAGAVVVGKIAGKVDDQWHVLGVGSRVVDASNNPIAQADIVAIQQAAQRLGTADLDGTILFTTTPPSNVSYASCWTSNVQRIIVDQDQIPLQDLQDYTKAIEARSVVAQRFDQNHADQAREVINEWARRWPNDPLLSAMDTNTKALNLVSTELAAPIDLTLIQNATINKPPIPLALHQAFTEKAIHLSKAALVTKPDGLPVGAPFGAIVVREDDAGQWFVAGEGFNRVNEKLDVTSHGEIEAIRNFCELQDRALLKQSVMYTSCEPCAICYSAIKETGIRWIYYGNALQDTAKLFDLSGQYQWMSLPESSRCEIFTETCKL